MGFPNETDIWENSEKLKLLKAWLLINRRLVNTLSADGYFAVKGLCPILK